jgi:tetratricopeptide (TPR) repeat protein
MTKTRFMKNSSLASYLPVVLAISTVWFSLLSPAFAQHQHESESEKPPMLLSGLGNHSHPITTRNPEAQKFFDQGLALLYGFNRYEALRSFRRAAELDPEALMPYWGLAMAQGPYVNIDLDGGIQMKESCEAVHAGLALRDHGSERERGYIDAVASRCPDYRPDDYIRVMKELSHKYPDDLDAATLYAESLMIPVRWKWWLPDGTPAEGMDEAVRVLEAVLRRDPDHPGANHFYIHAVEMSPSPERAIPSAQRLMGAVPASGHLVHMPAHIWLLMGDYELAAEINENAAERDREYMQLTGVSGGSYCGYYIHNLHFVAYARQMQGRMTDAIRSAETMSTATSPLVKEMPMMADAFVSAPLFAMLRFQQWDSLLALKAPHQQLLTSTALWHFGRAIAFTAKGKRQDALQEKTGFETARRAVPKDWLWLNNKSSDILDLASAILNARMADNDRASIPDWERAVALEDALIYDEPPPWFFPVRESLGGALLRAGMAAQAETVFREGLRRRPRNGRMLFGLMKSLEAQQKTDAAAMVQKEFETAWKSADTILRVEYL